MIKKTLVNSWVKHGIKQPEKIKQTGHYIWTANFRAGNRGNWWIHITLEVKGLKPSQLRNR